MFDAAKANENKNRVHHVKQKAPNNWGLYDVFGNVWEWVSSKPMPYPYNPNDGRESQSGEGTYRMLRGGSYWDSSWSLGPTSRLIYIATADAGHIGFRVAASSRK